MVNQPGGKNVVGSIPARAFEEFPENKGKSMCIVLHIIPKHGQIQDFFKGMNIRCFSVEHHILRLQSGAFFGKPCLSIN